LKQRITAFALICGLVSSCAHTVRVEAPTANPVVEKTTIKVAVVYDEALRNHRCTVSKGYIADEWSIALGSASMATFTPIFLSMFEDVVILPAGAETPMDDSRYVIGLSLEEYTGCDAAWPIVGSSVAITYSADVTHGSAKVLEAWSGFGEATVQDIEDPEGSASLDVEGKYLARMTTLAIRKAAADFVWNFEEDERVRAWKSAAMSDARND
jgi:hypothetical protein